MKANSAHRLLPFRTFGEAAAFDLEVEVCCRCGRRVVIDGMAPPFRDRRIMGTRFRCTTMLPHGVACAGLPSMYIRKHGRGRWTMAEHSRAIRARQEAAPIDAKPGTFASIVTRYEVAFLYDWGCVHSYTVAMIEFDGPAMFQPLHDATTFLNSGPAGARPKGCIFRGRMPIPHATAQFGVEQPRPVLARGVPADLDRIGLVGQTRPQARLPGACTPNCQQGACHQGRQQNPREASTGTLHNRSTMDGSANPAPGGTAIAVPSPQARPQVRTGFR
jgi:hypothetical protein